MPTLVPFSPDEGLPAEDHVPSQRVSSVGRASSASHDQLGPMADQLLLTVGQVIWRAKQEPEGDQLRITIDQLLPATS
jgi:hypothetical protein